MGAVADFPRDGGATIKYGDVQIAVFNFATRGEWYACQNMCPHKNSFVLSRGIIGSAGNEPKVACPLHKKSFSLQTGGCLTGELADACLAQSGALSNRVVAESVAAELPDRGETERVEGVVLKLQRRQDIADTLDLVGRVRQPSDPGRFGTQRLLLGRLMRREKIVARPDWQQRVEKLDFTWHTIDGQPYWAEDRCYSFTADEIDGLDDATAELHRLCRLAVEKVIADKLWDRFGIPTQFASYIETTWRRPDPEIYGRFDLLYDGTSAPKLLEYNADTPTALYEAAVIQWYWLQDVKPKADQFNSIHEKLIASWKSVLQLLPSRGLVHFACDQEAPEDFGTTEYMRDVANQAGLKTQPIALADIGWNGLRFTDLSPRSPERGGGLWYLAAAEQTDNFYDDGEVVGSAVGIVRFTDDGNEAGEREIAELRYAPICDERGEPSGDKVEGVCEHAHPDRLWAVTDPDDPDRPGELLELELSSRRA